MDSVASISPNQMLENAQESELVDKTQCLKHNNGIESQEVDDQGKDTTSISQTECNKNTEDIEMNSEKIPNLESTPEKLKDVLCSELESASENNEVHERDCDEPSNVQNISAHDLKNENDENQMSEECNMQSTANQDLESGADTNHGDNGNQTSTLTADPAPSYSSQLPIRSKCKYGSQCYRLNAEHKATFSHPGDTDYDTPDNRPECPYGTECYRKNPQHKLDYKHTVTKRKRTRNPVQTSSLDDFSDVEDSMEESVDESEYEASFIDDDDDLDDDFESDFASDELDEENEDDDNSGDENSKKKKKVKTKKQNEKKRKKLKTK